MPITTLDSSALTQPLGIGTLSPNAGAKITIANAGNQLYLQDTRATNPFALGLITYNQNGILYYDANALAQNNVTGGHIWRVANVDRMVLSNTGRLTVQGNTSSGMFLGAESESYSYSGNAPQSGVTEIFKVLSIRLCTSGVFSISATRGSFVHSSMWSWTTTHNGTGRGVLTQLSSGDYTNITLYLDVNSNGSALISADWGGAQEFMITVHKYTGNTVDFSGAGTLWSSPSPSYPTRYSRLTISFGFATQNGKFDGSLSKGSGSFSIPHPLPALSPTHNLVHSFIEGPQADLIYRGRATLVNGQAQVDIDASAGMTAGTFEALCRDVQCFTSNETGWSAVKGSVTGSRLAISCENTSSTDTVSWMVVGERQDQHMMDTEWTDEQGRVVVEPLKNPVIEHPPYPAQE